MSAATDQPLADQPPAGQASKEQTETPLPPPEPPFSLYRAMAYMGASMVLALSQGLGQGFVTTNMPQIAGDLGITTTEAAWLMAAYMIPRAVLPLMLIKIRTQYGLRRFAEIGIALYVLVSFAAVWMSDLRSAVTIQFLSGCAAAPLATLAFLYMLEPLPQQWKMRIGLPLALLFLMSAPNLSRVISPALIGDGGLTWVHLVALALAMMSMGLVYLLPLRPVPRERVIKSLDIVSFLLIGMGFGGLVICFVMGPIHYWTEQAWIGVLLAISVLSLTGAVAIELNRKEPLIDIRWLTSPAILHLTATLFLFRLILSEQSSGAPRMFTALDVAPSQMITLFTVILIACVMGALACIAWIKPGREKWFHLAALVLIFTGALMDSRSTVLTRPEQMLISQALIGCAGMLFMPPAAMMGLLSALAKGPQYLLSFVIVFLSTQSLGGVLGSGLFTTFINHRQAGYFQALAEQLTVTGQQTTAAIAAGAAMTASRIADPVQQQLQGVSLLVQEVTRQSYVLAYNDAYFLIALIAGGALTALLLHVFRDWLVQRMTRDQGPSDITEPKT